jgi:large subunit ribosomal protein L32
MAVPKFKTSSARTKRRRSVNMKLVAPTLVECKNCGNKVQLHRVCPKCGFYRGKQVLTPDTNA